MKFEYSDQTMAYQDEFDVYFARAKLDEEMAREKLAEDGSNRRGSLPGEPVIHLDVQPHHRRALSCKLPSRKKSRKGSKSPKEGTPPSGTTTPTNLPLIETKNVDSEDRSEEENEMQGISMNYVTEATLRAPSPRFDTVSGGGGSFKCHSAPHSRSSSWKNKKRPRSFKHQRTGSQRNGETDSPESRSRQGSVTQFEEEVTQKLEQLKLLQAEDVCVVRNFSTSSKGLINRGDSFKRKPRNSTTSNTSEGASGSDLVSPVSAVSASRGRHISIGSCNTGSSIDTPPIHRVLVIGDRGVGKTALLQQFMTSHYMGAAETSFDDEFEKTVTVLLDGEETMIDFVEVPVETDLSQYGQVDGYLMCFSITSKPSFHYMKEVLESIIKSSDSHQAIIVVANKSDLVRKRQVSENESRIMCIKNDCKYVEVSAGINHKVDDLLVGITTQIRLNPVRKEEKKSVKEGQKNISCVSSAKGLMQLIFKRNHMTSKSCDNLLVL